MTTKSRNVKRYILAVLRLRAVHAALDKGQTERTRALAALNGAQLREAQRLLTAELSPLYDVGPVQIPIRKRRTP